MTTPAYLRPWTKRVPSLFVFAVCVVMLPVGAVLAALAGAWKSGREVAVDYAGVIRDFF